MSILPWLIPACLVGLIYVIDRSTRALKADTAATHELLREMDRSRNRRDEMQADTVAKLAEMNIALLDRMTR